MKYEKTKKIVLSAMFVALGIVLPFFTGQLHGLGKVLLPMHIPVFLCGLICGWQYGGIVGFILPLLRAFMFSMPKLYPEAIGMAFELATYGAVSGVLYREKNDMAWLYISIMTAMIAGRVVWGILKAILLGVWGEVFTFEMFVGTAILEAIPGILLQLVLIPAIISGLEFSRNKKEKTNEKVFIQK